MNIAVIFAGGTGTRMHTKEKPKQFLNMHGKPIIVHTLEQFENHKEIDAIVVACIGEWIPYLESLVQKYNLKKIMSIVPGGSNGQQSIFHGLCAAKAIADEGKSIVLIHDGVRPLIDEKVISDSIQSVKNHGSAIASVKVKETVLLVDDKDGIREIPERSQSRLARAPQSFWLEEILEAHQRAEREGHLNFVDSCSMMQYYGKRLYLIESPEENIKITTPEDFYVMRAMLDAKEDSQIYRVEG
ncbi:MAG: 2-C-methyl-D-erythritol 4-phosphate cytidylyltransferase [Clostridiales bacterium]|nr:2-C-methyl-D-erythritol 4-phosphate cytidylyltransferase [Clostridiales bacterium]